jgi:hypothetical protein
MTLEATKPLNRHSWTGQSLSAVWADAAILIHMLLDTLLWQDWKQCFQRSSCDNSYTTIEELKVGCLHPVACTRSGSGFPSNATLVWIFYSIITATCFGRMTIFKREYIHGCMLYAWLAFIILKVVVCILLRVLGQVQGFRWTQHCRMAIFRWLRDIFSMGSVPRLYKDSIVRTNYYDSGTPTQRCQPTRTGAVGHGC